METLAHFPHIGSSRGKAAFPESPMTATTLSQTAYPSLPLAGAQAERATGLAMRRGAAGRCPACGEKGMFSSYLKVRDACPACDEALHHQRADDGPAYMTIVIVSHILTPILLAMYIAWRPSVASMLIGFLGAAIVMSLVMLPMIKGAFVGLQWARRMHGFGDGDAASE